MATKIRIRRDSYQNFVSNNVVLALGEIALANDISHQNPAFHSQVFFIGDGVKKINELVAFRPVKYIENNFVSKNELIPQLAGKVDNQALVDVNTSIRALIDSNDAGYYAYFESLIVGVADRVTVLENSNAELTEVDGGAAV